MIKLLFVSILVLNSSVSFAEELYGFNAVPKEYKTSGESLEVTNLPPVMSQDTLGICFAYVASTMLTAENCRYFKSDCTKIENKDLFSPIALTENATIKNGKKDWDAGARIDGGNSSNIMQLIVKQIHGAPSEQCVSLDKILSKIGGAKNATNIQQAAWDKLKKTYDQYQSLKGCETCAANFYASAVDEINQTFEIKKTNEEILKAFGKETYQQFVARLFFPKECMFADNQAFFEAKRVKVMSYPEENQKANYASMINQIKKTLSEKRPVALGNLCLDKIPKKNKDCQNPHEMVVSGFRKVCKSKNNCYDAIKVISSWGKSWQTANSDGWVEAKTLLDRTLYQENTLTYFEDKAAE